MAQRLFSTAKVLVFCDTYKPGIEKRRGDEVAILTLTLRVQPFDAQLARSLDDGVGGDSNVRSTVFSHNTEPKPHFTRHDFKLDLDDALQTLTVFASSDTAEARIAIDQVKIGKTYVRMRRDATTLELVFKASFGPVSRDELEYVHAWVHGQRAVTFTESEGALDLDEPPDDDEAEMFETDSDRAEVIDAQYRKQY